VPGRCWQYPALLLASGHGIRPPWPVAHLKAVPALSEVLHINRLNPLFNNNKKTFVSFVYVYKLSKNGLSGYAGLSLYLVIVCNRWGRSPALLLPRHREPASGCPCWPSGHGIRHRATGLPEGRSRFPAALQLPNAAVPGDGLTCCCGPPVSGVPPDTLLTKLTEGAFVSSVSR
jgi:hypothetical protein